MFIASVIISTLPVLSPLPKSVPSILSAPARSPNSASATPVEGLSGLELDGLTVKR